MEQMLAVSAVHPAFEQPHSQLLSVTSTAADRGTQPSHITFISLQSHLARKAPMQTRRKKPPAGAGSGSQPAIELNTEDDQALDTSQTVEADDIDADDSQPDNRSGMEKGTSDISNDDASLPGRRPVQRLASVLTRGGVNSSSPRSNASVTRPASLKFQPKVVARRSKEDRDAFDRAEAERAAARASAGDASARHQHGPWPGSRGRGGSQRGGRNTFDAQSRNASGVMGSAAEKAGSKHGRVRNTQQVSDVGASQTGHNSIKGKTKVKKEVPDKGEIPDTDVVMTDSNAKKRKKADTVKEEDDMKSVGSDREDLDLQGITKINIEEINLISSEDELSGTASQDDQAEPRAQRRSTSKARNWIKRPIFIQRHEHAERTVGLNTEASSITSAELRRRAKARQQAGENLFVADDDNENAALLAHQAKTGHKTKDVVFVRDERKWKGVWTDDGGTVEAQIKSEPQDDSGLRMDIGEDDQHPLPETGAQAEASGPVSSHKEKARKPAPQDASDVEMQDADTTQKEHPLIWEEYEKYDDYARTSLLWHIYVNDEDETLLDLDKLSATNDAELEEMQELQMRYHAEQEATTLQQVEGNSIHEGKQALQQTHASDLRRSYLLQLPPVMPLLHDANAIHTTIKSEPEGATDESAPSPSSTRKSPGKASKDAPLKVDQTSDMRTNHTYIHDSSNKLVGGQAGTLTFYENGKGLATWGGHSFEVLEEDQVSGQAREMFIMDREVKFRKSNDEEKFVEHVELGGRKKQGVAVGSIERSMIVTPDWSSLME